MATQKLYAGVKLREIRGRLALTQKAFADKLSVSLPYLNQMENNHRPVSAAVVLAHNHPSGTVQPSRADEALTQTLKAALALLDIRVLDHIIVGPGQALSMAEKGLL